MKLVRNVGADRVIDLVLRELKRGHRLDAITGSLSLFAFQEIAREAVAVVRLNGEDVAVKYFSLRGKNAVLESKNENYPPIIVPLERAEVLGRVVEAIRRKKW